MKYINLSKGKRAVVDDSDYKFLSQWAWQFGEGGYQISGYAVRTDYSTKYTIRMHRVIMGKVPKGFTVDHINGNRLDNRKQNLRIVSWVVNNINRKTFKSNKSGYRGLFFDKRIKAFRVTINVNKKSHYLGSYRDFNEAVKARQRGELRHHVPLLHKEVFNYWLASLIWYL